MLHHGKVYSYFPCLRYKFNIIRIHTGFLNISCSYPYLVPDLIIARSNNRLINESLCCNIWQTCLPNYISKICDFTQRPRMKIRQLNYSLFMFPEQSFLFCKQQWRNASLLILDFVRCLLALVVICMLLTKMRSKVNVYSMLKIFDVVTDHV